MINTISISVVTLLYTAAAADFFFKRDHSMGIIYVGYTIANVGWIAYCITHAAPPH